MTARSLFPAQISIRPLRKGAAVGETVGSSVGRGVGGTGAALGEAVGETGDAEGDAVVGVISSTMLAMTSSMVGSTQ